jgi:outer membrane lipoprotein carrier protein
MFKKSFAILFILSTLMLVNNASAQTTKAETSDPKAKTLLDKVKKVYDGFQTLESGFTLTIKLAEQPKEEVQKGKFYQEGAKYKAETGKDFIISDGKVIWQKNNNTVYINDASSKGSGSFLSPKDLIKLYEGKDYIYTISGEAKDGWSTKATIITFKPVGRKGDFTQLKVAIDQNTNMVTSITAFGKDQSRYKVTIEQPVTNKKYATSFFAFDKAKYPNIKVEDLRTD